VADHLRSLGMQNVQIFPTEGHPIVYGELLTQGRNATVLIYGHYDVQPPEPIELWKAQLSSRLSVERTSMARCIRYEGTGDGNMQALKL